MAGQVTFALVIPGRCASGEPGIMTIRVSMLALRPGMTGLATMTDRCT